MAIQFLHKIGKHVTAFTTSEKKKDLLKKLGADKIVISKDPKQKERSCWFYWIYNQYYSK